MRHSNQLLTGLLAFALSAMLAGAQGPSRRRDMTPTILKEPAGWRFEKMPIPPGFAPDIKLAGFEEIRFAPGVFDTSSGNYWTCVLVISAEGTQNLGAADVKDYLEKYYKGLSVGVGRRKGLSPDASQMVADVAAAQSGNDARNRYAASIPFFDTFNDGRKITLNVEAHVVPRPESRRVYLTLLVSPQPKNAAVWQTLREIEAKIDFAQPGPQAR
jgi:hypothetical protein